MSSLTDRNHQHFDKVAHSDRPDLAELTRRVTEELRYHRDWISDLWTDSEKGKGKTVKLLDYACGTGTISKALEPFVTKIVGLDLSENMVGEYNRSALELGIPPEKMSAFRANLLADELPKQLSEAEFRDFDLAIVGLALHHIEEPGLLLKRLAAFLRKGGVCLVLDCAPTEPGASKQRDPFEVHKDIGATVGKSSFAEQEMQNLFDAAGLSRGFDYRILKEPFKFPIQDQVYEFYGFMARGELR